MLALFSSRLKRAFTALGLTKKRDPEASGVHETRDGKLRFQPPPRMVKLRIATKHGFFGPVFLPSREFHHVSRQTCRAALRGLAFAQISKTHPQFSRRTRRAVSRTLAKLEYLRMMRDDTNALPDNEHQAATRGAVAGQ